MSLQLEELEKNVVQYKAHREQLQQQFHQATGALHILESQIKLLKERAELEKEKLAAEIKEVEAQDDKALAELDTTAQLEEVKAEK